MDNEIDIVHLRQPDGTCVISVNGQGHLPCNIHVMWEKCEGCGREYQYPHLCRQHHLCGLCHPPVR